MEEVSRFFSNSIPASQVRAPFVPQHVVMPSQLVILKQKVHSEEVISKNGIQRTIFNVVKNSPFTFQLGTTNSNGVKANFNQIAFEAHLLYDCEGNKEVDYIKVKPLEFKAIPNENGQRLDTELRIKVLSSQHEDMFFRIKIQGHNPLTKEELPGMTFLSPPIKVISKPEQLKKSTSATAAAVPAASPTSSGSKKRSLVDMLVETVARIEAKQEEQQKLISRLMTQQVETAQCLDKRIRTEGPELALPSPGFSDSPSSDLNPPHQSLEGPSSQSLEKPPVDFEEAFANLIRAYNSMSAEQKPEIIRKLIRNSSSRDTERLSELLDLFWTEGLQKEMGTRARESIPMGQEGCSCTDCPHRQELSKIDDFYRDFLMGASGLGNF